MICRSLNPGQAATAVGQGTRRRPSGFKTCTSTFGHLNSAAHLVSAARRRLRCRRCTLTYVEAPPAARIWRPWTIWLPCVLAFFWSGFLIFLDVVFALASLLNDNAEPQTGWVYPAVIGQCVLAGASVVALLVGLRSPSRRRTAAITAWMIIPVGLGWLVLIGRLLAGS